MKFIKYTLLLVTLSIMISCGEAEKKEEKKSVKIGSKDTPKQTNDNIVNIGLTGNDLMQYSTNEIKVKAGQEVKLTFRHIGKMGLKVMGHNFVQLKPGTEIPVFSIEAANAG